MLDTVAVGTEDDALLDFAEDHAHGETHPHHFRDGEVLCGTFCVVELQNARIPDSAAGTLQRLLIILEPRSQPRPPFVGASPFAAATALATIFLAIDNAANLEPVILPLNMTILAELHCEPPWREFVSENTMKVRIARKIAKIENRNPPIVGGFLLVNLT
jgi:hypothetical protein